MESSFLTKGLFTEELLKKISYLSYSKELREINALLTKTTRKLKKFIRLSFIFDLANTLSLFLVLVFIPYLIQANFKFLIALSFSFLSLQLVVLYVRSNKTKAFFNYHKITKDLSDNLISSIFDDYKLSLGDKLPAYTSIQRLTIDLVSAGDSLIEYLRFIREFIALAAGTVVVVAYAFITGSTTYILLSYIISIIFILYFVHTVLDGIYFIFDQDYRKTRSLYDRKFLYSAPLLTRTIIDFDENKYLKNLKTLSNLFSNKLTVEMILKSLVPIFIFLFVVISGDLQDGMLFILVGIFLANRLFQISNVVRLGYFVDLGHRRLTQINDYFDKILELGTEITPNIYKSIRKDYINNSGNDTIGDRLVWGDLIIKNMNYISGRGQTSKQILVDDLVLPYGKISILIGKKDIGKSIFGRILTLRYSRYEAERLSIGEKDIRTFSSLDSGLKYLHYSELRDVSTSYRNTISMYIHENVSANSLTRKIFSNFPDKDKVKEHFLNNQLYYKDFNSFLLPIFEMEDINLIFDDVKEGYPVLVSEIFQNINPELPLREVLTRLTLTLGKKTFEKALLYTAIAEHIAYSHLKKYVPEATVHYMDANLNRAPISKELRLRFLYAIDIFIEGLLFIVDEPFTNLDTQNAKNVLNDFIEYAKNYNAIVLILDEALDDEIIEEFKNKNVFGKLLRFEDDGFVSKIKANDIG